MAKPRTSKRENVTVRMLPKLRNELHIQALREGGSLSDLLERIGQAYLTKILNLPAPTSLRDANAIEHEFAQIDHPPSAQPADIAS